MLEQIFLLVDTNFQGIGDDPFSTYANISQRANIFYPLIRTRTCAYQGVGNKSLLGKFCVHAKWMIPNGKYLGKFNNNNVRRI